MRFPFTFMGIVSLGVGIFVVVYLSGHRGLDPVATGVALAAAALAFGFGAYILLGRAGRGGAA